jgi:NAD+ synthase (glutamine-hydrolysing)
MKIGGASLNQTPLAWDVNTRNIIEAIQRAKGEEVQLLCLPELCITGYSCEDMFLHPWVAERAMDQLIKLVPQTNGIAVTLGLPIWYESKLYNALVFAADGQIKGIYTKQHLPKDGVHYEYRWFEQWIPNVVKAIKIQGIDYPIGHITSEYLDYSIGFEICEDAWVEDRPACHLSHPVDIILNTSASHFAFNKVKRRHEVIRSSSEQFNCVYVYANQVGNESGRIIYDGDVIIAQKGNLLATGKRLSFNNVNLHSVQVDIENTQNSEIRLYDQITEKNEEFPQALSLALFDYLRKSRSKGFVLSISGGADSSTIAVMIAEMVRRGSQDLGWDGFVEKLGIGNFEKNELMKHLLTTAYQGTANSSEDTFDSARALAEQLGATFHHWTIDKEVASYRQKVETAIGRPLTWVQDDITLQNIQARTRSPIIWMLANINNALLLATSNRSEGSVGYATMDGDTSGSISPIAGADKAFIREWLKYAEKELGYSALSHVNGLAPTAELRPLEQTQTDEEDLMPYDVLARIEYLFVKERLSPEQIQKRLSDHHSEEDLDNWISKFFRLWKRNQWKRERFAPSFHLDDYNIDPRSGFRYPILGE